MNWVLDKSKAICPQLSEQLCMKIACGEFLPNEKLLSVRELAVEAGVNPNTVQHAFEELERLGLLYSIRGSGWYVSEDITASKEVLEKIRQEKTTDFFKTMNTLGLSNVEIKKYVEEWYNE